VTSSYFWAAALTIPVLRALLAERAARARLVPARTR
jgi:hypothetical protein